MTDQVSNLQIKVESGDVVTATQRLDGLAKTSTKTGREFETAMAGMERGSRAGRQMVQNMSWQIQDIAVQAQMGTSALTILGQQGPQILSVFGAGGAVAGGLVAVAALLGSLVMETDRATESLDDFLQRAETMGQVEAGRSLRDMTKSVSETEQEIERLQVRLDYAKKAFDDGVFSQKTYADAVEKIRIEGEKLGVTLDDLQGRTDVLTGIQNGLSLATQQLTKDFQEKTAILKIADERERYIAEQMLNVKDASEKEAQAVREAAGGYYDQKKALEDNAKAQREAEAASKRAAKAAEREIETQKRKQEQLERQAQSWLERSQYYGQSQLEKTETWQNQELDKLAGFMEKKALTAEEGQAAYERIMQESMNRQVSAVAASEAEKKRLADEALRSQQQAASMWLDMTSTMLDVTTNMLEQSGAENTGFMKALLAAQKALAIPSIIVSTEAAAQAAMQHETLLGGMIAGQTAANLIRAQGAISAGIVAGTAIAGMFDNGGVIPAGQMGIVGEFGPEFVKGPAVVTSRAKTAEMARAAVSGGQGGGTGGTIINQYFTVGGTGDKALREAMAQAAKQGTDNALAQVRNDAMTNGPIRQTYNV